MEERRSKPRLSLRMPIRLNLADSNIELACHTHDISMRGLRAEQGHQLQPGRAVRVVLQHEEHSLQIASEVVHVGPSGAGITFVEHGTATRRALHALLTPHWDGDNLLDGVLSVAPWYRSDDFAGWMKLTTLLSTWRRLPHKSDDER